MTDKDIYSTLRSTVDQLNEHPQADRHKFKKMFPGVMSTDVYFHNTKVTYSKRKQN